jgi:hypothetical protein
MTNNGWPTTTPAPSPPLCWDQEAWPPPPPGTGENRGFITPILDTHIVGTPSRGSIAQ